MSQINLIFFRMSTDNPLVRELSNYYKRKDNYNVEFISSDAEANQFLSTDGNGIFVFEVKAKADLQASVNILKTQRKLIKNGLVKPACILHVKNKKVEKILTKYGCGDLLDDDIKAKTLSFKIDFWSRGLTALLKKKDKEMELKQNKAEKSKASASKKKEDFNYVDPLQLQSDIWISKSKADSKKILRRWLIRMLGPSPYIGNWVELESQPGERLPTWKYVLKNDDGQYILEDGAWFFSGSKPEFDWKINRWNFSSDTPHLYFYSQDGKVFSRFKFENGSVHIAENSQYALTKEEIIVESCDSKFNIEADEKEDEESSNFEGDSETDHLDGRLEGESGKEEDLGGHLSGKSKGSDEDEESADGAKKSSYQEDALEGHMKGKSSGALDDNEENKDNKKDPSYKEDAIDGHYDGKSSTDALGRDSLSPRPKSLDESNETHDPKRSGFKEDPIEKHYGGKSSTDKLDKDPLAAKNKDDNQPESNEAKRSNFKEDPIEKNYGGKSKTDDLDRSPYGGKGSTDELDRDPMSGKTKSNQELDEKDQKRSDFKEDPIEKNYGGKSKTDDVDRSPYGGKGSTEELDRDPMSGKTKPNQEQDKDPSRSDFKENPIEKNYGGKSKTDEVDRSPYGGKGSTDELDRDPMSGKSKSANNEDADPRKNNFKEDSIETNYGGKSKTDNVDRSPYGGKGSTDELDGDPMSGKASPSDRQNKHNNKTSAENEDLGGHYASKNSSNKDKTNKDNHSNLDAPRGADTLNDHPNADEPRHDDPALDAPPVIDDPELAQQIEDELTRAGLKAIDKDGNPVSMDEVAQMTEEELSRAGIQVLDKDDKPIDPKDVKDEIEKQLKNAGIDLDEHRPKESNKKSLKDDPKLAQQVDDELSRAGLKAIDKDGNPIPMDDVAQMTEEELSRAGIQVLDKDNKPVESKDVKDEIKQQLDKAGIDLDEHEKRATHPTKNPLKDNPELAKQVDDELSRAGLKAIDKDGNPVPMDDVAQMTEEEMSRAGIQVLDKDKKPIPPKDVSKEIDKKLREIGKKDIADQIQKPSGKNKFKGGVKESSSTGFDPNRSRSAHDKASEMEAALGGGLADISPLDSKKEETKENNKKDLENKLIGKEKPKDKDGNPLPEVIGNEQEQTHEKESNLDQIIGTAVDVNTESGELRVVLKQTTKVGNDITFICDFEDFYEDELVVQAPIDSLAINSQVKAKISLNYNEQKIVVYAEGKIVEKEEYNEKKESLILELSQIDSKLYEKFMELYQDRQENIMDFLDKAKGF